MSGHHTLGTATLRERQASAVADTALRGKLARASEIFTTRKAGAFALIDDVDGLRQAARSIRSDINSRLPSVLERFADNVMAAGGNICWAKTGAEANAYIVNVAKRIGAKTAAKGKSMATEEIELNGALEAAGCEVVETDLGEWIIQLDEQTPSHIIAPAIHLDRYDIARIFDERANAGGIEPIPEVMNAFARGRLREKFLAAELGVTGCNLAIAESGSILLVENEGNGRMSSTLPRVHIAVMGMERIVETWAEADLIVNLLARSGTGQHISVYTNIVTGPRRPEDVDGPEEFHVVILDNGRSELLASDLHEMLDCIRCGACLNVCPVYRQTGGHAYGWVYSGPMGAVLTPLLAGHVEGSQELANASTLCGACMDACPVGIPLQDLLLSLRRTKAAKAGAAEKAGWRAWSAAWSHRSIYEASVVAATSPARKLAGSRVATKLVPGAGRWALGRELPTPASSSFRSRWKKGDL